MGKFSVYFVVLSTAIVILLFILALYRLIRHCQRQKAQTGEFFGRGRAAACEDCDLEDTEEDEASLHARLYQEGVDPRALLADSQFTANRRA